MKTPNTAVVVGGGLSGLSAAWKLQKAGWDVTILEACDSPGGRVATVHKQGYILDTGASAHATSYRAYLALAQELGLADQSVEVSPDIEICKNGQRHAMDLSQPLWSGIKSRLLSPLSKLRMSRLVVDVLIAKIRGQLDYADMSRSAPLDIESAREYASRALNTELADYFCDPLVRIMLIADAKRVSKAELFSGIANILGARMLAMQGGINSLPKALAEKLSVEYNAMATRVRETGNSIEVRYIDSQQLEQTLTADACVVACPLPIASELSAGYSVALDNAAQRLHYTSAITVSFGLTVRPNTDAFLVLLPACEYPELALLFIDHNKSADRVPDGKYMVTAHLEAQAAKERLDDDDESLINDTLAQILTLFPELEGAVELTHVTRWSRALPLTSPGAYCQIAELKAGLDSTAPIQFAGDYLSAAGQNTAVEVGTRAAVNILER